MSHIPASSVPILLSAIAPRAWIRLSDSSSNITEEPIVSVIQALFNLRCVSAIKFRGIMGIISVKASQILNALCKRASHRKAPGTAAEKPQQTTAKSHVAKSKHVRLLTCRCLRIGFVASGLVRKSSVLWMRHIEDVHPMRLHASQGHEAIWHIDVFENDFAK